MRAPTTHSLAVGLTLALLGLVAAGCGGPEKEIEWKLQEHVLFFSNFEKGVDALSSAGSILAEIDGAHEKDIVRSILEWLFNNLARANFEIGCPMREMSHRRRVSVIRVPKGDRFLVRA